MSRIGTPIDAKSRPVNRSGRRLAATIAMGFLAALSAEPAAAQKARITGLTDVSFGQPANLQIDHVRSQSVCVFSNGPGARYGVTAAGSGPNGAFQLSSGMQVLAYEVLWSPEASRNNGNLLQANRLQSSYASQATHQFCNNGPSTSASLSVVIRAADLSRAVEGAYSGTLSILISAE